MGTTRRDAPPPGADEGDPTPVLDPAELFTVDPEVEVPRGLPMVQALDGFIDAGAARRLTREHLAGHGDPVDVAVFDVDQLFDYRARRPVMLFVRDHWESYDAPHLALQLVRDAEGGRPSCCCAGPSPTCSGSVSSPPSPSWSSGSGCASASG